MSQKTDRQVNVLIVSSSDKFNEFLSRVTMNRRYAVPDFCESASTARRMLNERDYDLVIVNTPLKDEYGVDFTMDIGSNFNVGIILITTEDTRAGIEDRCADVGAMVISRPITNHLIDRSIRLICSIRAKYSETEEKVKSLEDKMEEIRSTNRSVNRAKWMLVENRHMSEDEAHRYIEKAAMDTGRSKKDVADEIISAGG